MTEPVRFPAQVPYAKWPAAENMFAAIVVGDWALAQQRYALAPQDIADACGAVQSWYLKFAPAGVPVKLNTQGKISSTPIDFTYEPGFITAFESAAEGGGSASAGEGSEGLYGGVFDTLPASANPLDPAQFPAWGRSAIMGLPIKPGQFLLLYQVKQAELSGRADVR